MTKISNDQEFISDIDSQRVFDRQSAQSALGLIRRVTEKYSKMVKQLTVQHGSLMDSAVGRKSEIEAEIDRLMAIWQDHIRRLGAEPKGLWTVDFDSGDGYFCWKYPENEIGFWHGYKDGFPGRKALKIVSEHDLVETP